MLAKTFLLCQWATKTSVSTPGIPKNPDIDSVSVVGNVIFKWDNSSPLGTTNEVWSSDVQQDGTQGAYSLLQSVAGNQTQISDATLPVGICRLYKVRACSSTCSSFTSPVAASNLYENTQIGAVDLPIVISFVLLAFDFCTTLTLSKLRQCKSEFSISTNPNITSLSLPALQSINNDLFVDTAASLLSISLPVLVSVGGNIIGSNDPALSSWNAPNIVFNDAANNPDFTGDTLDAASINQILARGVASALVGTTFNLAGGTNAAPSGQGVADKATLIGAGNTVNTN